MPGPSPPRSGKQSSEAGQYLIPFLVIYAVELFRDERGAEGKHLRQLNHRFLRPYPSSQSVGST